MKINKVSKISLEKDMSPQNIIKDKEGNIIGYNKSEFTCRVYFDNGESFWVPHNQALGEILKFISMNEDYKYPKGMGRNMIFYAYIYPLFKKHLEKNGFKVGQHTLDFVRKETLKVDSEYDKFLEDCNNETKD